MRRFPPSYEICFVPSFEICGNPDDPGMPSYYSDWDQSETTVDQLAIEDALDAMQPSVDEQILHVGIGNSGFAQRFAPRVKLVDGITVSQNEASFAESLSIDSYTVHLVSKYSRQFLLTIENKYDYIIDNNLASWACCRFHLYTMFENYRWCLRPGGRILTDQRGMDWTADGDPRRLLSYDDLDALGALFGLVTARVNDTVYEVCRRDVPVATPE